MNLKIGENIKTFRIQRNITQEELATYLGVTPQAVSKWESQNGYPDIELIPSIADFFSVATDDLFGLNKAEKEVRKAEIHKDIVRMRCESHSKESVNKLREYVAEFPSDEIIQSQLANMLCNVYMWEEEKNIAPLKEAERIYITLIDTTKDADFRNNMLASLVKLYAVGFNDSEKALNMLDKLPSMTFCKEAVASTGIYQYLPNGLKYYQQYIKTVASRLLLMLQDYIAYVMPNDFEQWDEKITMFEKLIEMYKLIFGEDMLAFHLDVASVYRYIATYTVAQGNYEKTLDMLEMTVNHFEKGLNTDGGNYTSPFINQLSYDADNASWNKFGIHNPAFYTLEKLQCQDRYDPIRNTERFDAIIKNLKLIAKQKTNKKQMISF